MISASQHSEKSPDSNQYRENRAEIAIILAWKPNSTVSVSLLWATATNNLDMKKMAFTQRKP
jgi:hypothetical protein